MSIGTWCVPSQSLDVLGITAHAYFRDADLAGGMDGAGAAGKPRSWCPLDEERQRRLGGSLVDARQSPAHELSVPAHS